MKLSSIMGQCYGAFARLTLLCSFSIAILLSVKLVTAWRPTRGVATVGRPEPDVALD